MLERHMVATRNVSGDLPSPGNEVGAVVVK
jgi:hypothetical protein